MYILWLVLAIVEVLKLINLLSFELAKIQLGSWAGLLNRSLRHSGFDSHLSHFSNLFCLYSSRVERQAHNL